MTRLKLNKQEIRTLIKEVLQERWIDIFQRGGLKSKSKKRSSKKIPLYHDLSKWEDDFLDDNGLYIGPEFTTLNFDAYDDFKKGNPMGSPGSEELLKNVMKWNEYLGELYSLSYKQVVKANQNISSKYYLDNSSSVLGSLS